MRLKSYRELFEQLDTGNKLDERILAIGREAEKGNADFREAEDFRATELLPEKSFGKRLSRGFALAAINVAACALVLLIVWNPMKKADVAATGEADSTEVVETVLSSDFTTSDASLSADVTQASESVSVTESAKHNETGDAANLADINFFSSIVPEEMLEYAFTPDFSDSDGHIVVRAEKMISDKLNTYLVLSYEYLDAFGKKWMEEYFMQLDSGSQSVFLSMDPAFKEMNTRKYGVNWHIEFLTAEEANLSQFETSSKKYFWLSYHASSDRYGTDCVRIEYLMPRGPKDAIIEITERLPKQVWQIESETLPDKYFQPTQVSISTLGLIIEGKDLGMGQLPLYKIEDAKRKSDSIELVFKDDSKLILYWFKYPYYKSIEHCQNYFNSAVIYTPEQIFDSVDCDIFTCTFAEPIDIEQVKGIWINDVYYELN